MHVRLREILGDAFIENVINVAPDQGRIKEVVDLIFDADHKFGDRSLAYSLRYNLIRNCVAQLAADHDQRVAMALGMVKLLKASDELSEVYYTSLMKDIQECSTRWEMIWMMPEPEIETASEAS